VGLQWNWLLKNKNLVEGGTFTTAIASIAREGSRRKVHRRHSLARVGSVEGEGSVFWQRKNTPRNYCVCTVN